MRFASSFFALVIAASCFADHTINYSFTLGGNPIGKSTFSFDQKGKFTVKGGFSVGGNGFTDDLTGVLEPKMSFSGTIDNGKAVVKVDYADQRYSLLVPSAKKPEPTVLKLKALPQVLMLNGAPGTLRILPKLVTPGKATKVHVLVGESGGEVDAEVSQAPGVLFKKETLSQYLFELAGLKINVLISPSTGDVVGWDVPSQTVIATAEGYENVFVDPVDKFPELSTSTFKTVVERGVKMQTRDGVSLVMDIARPKGEGKFPAILERTPYGRVSTFFEAEWWARRGYVFIAQDCRGRDDSGGDWDPFIHERADGADTVNWIAAQTWSDGNVGMIGGSYSGQTQWQAAVEAPPALKCIIPQVSPPDPMKNIPFTYGVPFLAPSIWWANLVKDKKVDFSGLGNQPDSNKLTTLPMSKMSRAVLGRDVPFVDKWWTRTRESDWAGANYQSDLDKVNIPALMISGWWDGDTIGTRTNWERMHDLGKSNQYLIYGAWEHGFNSKSKFLDVDYGPDSLIEIKSLYLRWFDTWLKGKDVGLSKVPKVRFFVSGENKWHSATDWPSPKSVQTTYYLTPSKSLSEKTKQGAFKMRFDPIADGLKAAKAKGLLTTKIDMKDGSLSSILLSTAAFSQPTTLTGPIRLDLNFSSTARDCDFIVEVVDIDAKGSARIICLPNALRASYRESLESPTFLTPGQSYRATVTMVDIAHQFLAGHKMGIVLANGGFPGFGRNTGTTDPLSTATKLEKSTQTILCGGASPSKLVVRTLKD